MKKFVFSVALIAVMAAVAYAGKAHFVGVPTITQSGDTVFVSGKVAGLGNIPQIHVAVTGFAECVNRGGNKPSAGNKEAFAAQADFPVQNGKSLFQLALEATFTPSCDPPMTVEWSNIQITVTADDGTFLVYP